MANETNKKWSWLKGLDVFLLALIICMNINKYYLGESNDVITYSVFFLFVASLWLNKQNRSILTIHVQNISVISITILLCVSALFGSLVLGTESLKMTLKLYVSLLVAVGAKQFSTIKIRHTIILVVIYNCIYGVGLGFTRARAVTMMVSGVTTYLNLTLTLGLTLSLSLCQILLTLYEINGKKRGLIASLMAMYTLLILSSFNARGSILLPIASSFLVLLFLMHQKPLKVFVVAIVLLLVSYIGYRLYISTVSEYGLSRMLRLFNDVRREGRMSLWSDYWKEIKDRRWYLLGGGPDASRLFLHYYPHNLYLQLLGEFGLVGILFSGVTTHKIIGRLFQYIRILIRNKDRINFSHEEITLLSITGFLYYFLTYMKSFSFFDAYPLFVFYEFTMKCTENPKMFLQPKRTATQEA